MYKIIGGDQKEYGPVTHEQLIQWIRDNRANAQTLVQREGGTWVALGSLPEFAEHLTPPTPQASSTSPSTPIPGPQPATGPSAYPLPSAYPTSGLSSADPRERARTLIQGPATALLITGILFVIFGVVGLIGNLMGAGFTRPPGDLPPELEPLFQMLEQMEGPVAIISTLIGLAISGLTIFAAQKMRALEGFVLVVIATILAMFPCTSPCCCIGIPIGIWVLAVLFKPEVKSAFS